MTFPSNGNLASENFVKLYLPQRGINTRVQIQSFISSIGVVYDATNSQRIVTTQNGSNTEIVLPPGFEEIWVAGNSAIRSVNNIEAIPPNGKFLNVLTNSTDSQHIITQKRVCFPQ